MNDDMEIELARTPERSGHSPTTISQSTQILDKWIEELMHCKPLPEDTVRRLCLQVRLSDQSSEKKKKKKKSGISLIAVSL